MLRKFLLPAVVAAGLAVLPPAWGLTLEPGTYKLEWRVPKDYVEGQVTAKNMYGSAVPAQKAKMYRGLVSKCPIACNDERWQAVLDESKGTGAGYDTLYIVTQRSRDGIFDAKQAIAVPLIKADGYLISDPDTQLTLTVPFGGVPREVTAAASAMVRTIGKETRGYVEVALGGAWVGKVRTDKGELDMFPIDANENGAFDDRIKAKAGGEDPDEGDALVIHRPSLLEGRGDEQIYLAKCVQLDGKLYSIDVSKTGDTVEIGPYTDPLGRLRIDATSPSGKKIKVTGAQIVGEAGNFSIERDTSGDIPVGVYTYANADVETAPAGKTPAMKLSVRASNPVHVNAGQPSVWMIGGPLKVEIQPDTKNIAAKRGGPLSLEVSFKLGADEVPSISGGNQATPKVTITSPKGKIVKTGKAEFG